jgi:hypothetical protein
MALTAAEKQQRYRERHLGVDGAKDRIQLFISAQAKAQLRRLARHHGCTVTKVVETLAFDAERTVLDQLPPRRQSVYLDGKTQHNADDDVPVIRKPNASRKQRKARLAPRRKVTV